MLFVAVPASACGGGSGDEPNQSDYRYCHEYTVHVGDESNGLHANERGQFLLAFQSGDDLQLGGHYVEQDVTYLDTAPFEEGWTFSIWYYFESNGRPGAQRADEACNNTPEGEESDSVLC